MPEDLANKIEQASSGTPSEDSMIDGEGDGKGNINKHADIEATEREKNHLKYLR